MSAWRASRGRCAAALLALVLAPRLARGQAAFEGAVGNIARQSITLRVPAAGSFTLTSAAGGYVTVGVNISGQRHTVRSVVWRRDNPPGNAALTQQSFRTNTTGDTGCRTEIFAAPISLPGPGHAEITLDPDASNPPDPSVAGSLMHFRNVAGASVDGACCSNVSTLGVGLSTISKTINNTGPLDMVLDSVCVSWTGADPGEPTADVATNERLVQRLVLNAGAPPNLYGLAATAVANPSGGGNAMRWQQTGQRDWSTTSLILVGQVGLPPPDAAVPPEVPDAAVPPDDLGAPDAAVLSDLGSGVLPDVPSLVDASRPSADGPDSAAIGDGPGGADGMDPGTEVGLVDASSGPDAISGEDPGTAITPIALQVGCACGLGGRGSGPAVPLMVAVALAVLRSRRHRDGRRP